MALYSWLLNSRIVDYVLTSITIGMATILAGIYALQTKLIYVPDFPPGSRKEVWRPSRFGFKKFEEVTLLISDGVKIHAYWIPCITKSSNSANAGNMGHRLPILKRISDSVEANFFIISYRGYGESEGKAEEKGIRKDAQAALDYILKEKADETDPKKLILYGQSIGGAVSIDLAARNQSKIAGIIVENTFLSLPKLIPHVIPLLGWAKRLCHQLWESEMRLREMLGAPLPKMLFLSGSKDELVPSQHMKLLYEILTSTEDGKKKGSIELFDKGTHNDTCLQPGYFEAIANFIRSI